MKLFIVCCGFLTASYFSQAALFGQATPITDRQAARLLDQAAWGPSDTAITQVQSTGISPWIDGQFAAAKSDIPDQALLNSAGNTNTDLAPVRAAFFQNATNGPDQLRQRMAFILSQIWVVSQASGVAPAYAYPVYWRVLRDNSFSTYAELIKAVTLNPAMGRYLNMANNSKAVAGSSANENYGRELMQLFTLGTTQLNPDGSTVVGTGGAPLATYTEEDVRNLAKALTGWTYPTAPTATAKTKNPEYYFGTMFPVESNHDTTAKTLLGVTIPAGQSASQDLDSVIAILMQQPTMAPFISRQLIEHLVTSNPSPQYISRISTVFKNTDGVTGSLKAVVKAILTDPEARLGDTAFPGASFGHLREPVLLLANLARGLNAGSTVDATNTLGNYASNLGENIFVPASVFSYFSPFARTEKGLYGPEFQIYSTQTAPTRSNYIYSLLYGTLGTTKADFTAYNAKGTDLTKLVDYINYVFLYHSASPDLVSNAIAAAKGAPQANAVKSALYVMLTSAEYQVIH